MGSTSDEIWSRFRSKTTRVVSTVMLFGIAWWPLPEPMPSQLTDTVAASTPSPPPAVNPSLPAKEELERMKLEEEILKLRSENERASGALGRILDFAPFITVIIGVMTLVAALWKQSKDLATARSKTDEETARWQLEFARQKDVDSSNAEKERLGRFDESLNRIAAQISSDNPGLSLNGAAALGLFAKPLYQDLHADLLRIIIANLKGNPTRQVSDLLREHLARVLRLLFTDGRKIDADVPNPIDLTNLDLYQVDFRGIQLPRDVVIDLAFANLKDANFSEMNMLRARAYAATLDATRFSRTHMNEARFNSVTASERPVKFHEASLVSATFEGAVLPHAEFQRARLQGAKFRRATLTGAHFEGAHLADAYFQGAVLDEAALQSIALNAYDWKSAHFDPDVKHRLDEISAQDSPA